MGTATLLGIGAGALFGQGAGDDVGSSNGLFNARLDYVAPFQTSDGGGLMAGGQF
jgi:hypothetical protein